MIYHVVTNEKWQQALMQGLYTPASVLNEGFIHASSKEQVKGVLERYYAGQTGLLLLHIDETKLLVPLKFELSPTVNELFPHIFGALQMDVVVEVETISSAQR